MMLVGVLNSTGSRQNWLASGREAQTLMDSGSGAGPRGNTRTPTHHDGTGRTRRLPDKWA